MGIYSSMVKPSSDEKTHDSEEESENTDFHHQMEEIVQQVSMSFKIFSVVRVVECH